MPKTSGRYSTLCRPSPDRSCFRCCPPIRPAGYDHYHYRSSLKRLLWENTREIQNQMAKPQPIRGYFCWGLGYLDRSAGLVGCLLHPGGELGGLGNDLRDLTGYGDKCRRERCGEAETFESLPRPAAEIVLNLADGMDSFEYSSPSCNPVWRLLQWGPAILTRLAEDSVSLPRTERRDRLCLLCRPSLHPVRDAYALVRLLNRLPLETLVTPGFLNRYRTSIEDFANRHQSTITTPLNNLPFVHQLDLGRDLEVFLRSVLGRPRITASEARWIGERLNSMLDEL